ncbi:MAG: hypothetical protein JST48_13810 [Bacteroidetes bacterium]|nr:hypothetical protein [Bacteroidota bacterium]
MKKVLYTLALVATLAVSFSACTEEVVNPKETSGGSGGVANCDKGC